MYEGYNTNTRWFVFFWEMEYVRKVILAFIVVVF